MKGLRPNSFCGGSFCACSRVLADPCTGRSLALCLLFSPWSIFVCSRSHFYSSASLKPSKIINNPSLPPLPSPTLKKGKLRFFHIHESRSFKRNQNKSVRVGNTDSVSSFHIAPTSCYKIPLPVRQTSSLPLQIPAQNLLLSPCFFLLAFCPVISSFSFPALDFIANYSYLEGLLSI